MQILISRTLRIFFKGGDNKALPKDGRPVQDFLCGAVKVVDIILLGPPSPFICLVVPTTLRFLNLVTYAYSTLHYYLSL